MGAVGPPRYPAAPPHGYGVGLPTPETRAIEARALVDVRTASILALVTAAMSIALLTESLFALESQLVAVRPTGTGPIISLPSPWLFVGLLAAEAVFLVAEIALLRRGFHRLASIDPSFATPARLALAALGGVVVLLVGAGIVLDGFYQAVACAGAGVPLTQSCLPRGTLLGGEALLLIGGVLALVGFIAILIGFWRLGTRYNDSLFKIGAILLIVPYVSFAGYVLLLVAAHRAHQKLAGPGHPPPVFPH